MADPKATRTEAPAKDAAKLKAPVHIRLTHRHSYIDDFGRHRVWEAGEIIGEPAEVDHLVERGALYEFVD